MLKIKKIGLVIIIIIMLAGLALELQYIEETLTNFSLSNEQLCIKSCQESGKQDGYLLDGNCRCRKPLTFSKQWRCFENITFTRDDSYENKTNTTSIRNLAVSLVAHYQNPDNPAVKIFAIYKRVSERVSYVSDPKRDEYIATPMETLWTGGGDCDDYSVLISSLYESVGLDASILEVYNETYGHVFVIVNIEQDLDSFMNEYKQILEENMHYSGTLPFSFLVFGSTGECSKLNEDLKSGKNLDSFYLVIEGTSKDYAGGHDSVNGFANIKFIEVGK